MIHTLQRLKAKRGFTMIELIVVVGIIAVMLATVLVGTNNRQNRISSANSAAKDFYSALQTEFTNFQMFDGPLTMTLDGVYSLNKNDISAIKKNDPNGGMKYYPAAGGNYPYAGALGGETHLNGTPKTAELYLEFHAVNGNIDVRWANTISALIGTGAPANSELSAVLEREMQRRIEYNDGYYYAKVSYTPPSTSISGFTKYDFRTSSVKVDWAAYTRKQMRSADPSTYTFKMQNLLSNGQVCGVVAGSGSTLGTTGTSFVPTVTP